MKLKLYKGGKVPEYSSKLDSGMDVFAKEDTAWYFKNGVWRCDVFLGFGLSCPNEYGIFILSRSGMGNKDNVTLVNSVGLGDRSFGSNEYRAMLIKVGVHERQPVSIKKHQKVAQIVIIHTPKITFDVVDDFCVEEVQKDGFGSSGEF